MFHRSLSQPVRLTLLAIALSSCGTAGSRVASEGQQKLVGLSAEDLQACAGIPQRTKRLDDGTQLLSYEQTNASRGGVNLTLPIIGGGFQFGNTGSYCHALFRLKDGHVTTVNYTGDNDDLVGDNGVCAPIVRGCLRAMAPAPGKAPPPPSSGNRAIAR